MNNDQQFKSGLNIRKSNRQRFNTEFSSDTDILDVKKQNLQSEQNKNKSTEHNR
ncbi:MAG: Small, acid-soluble spore protein gamma-type [Bacillales bacterium]|jgi:gamma type small acid-soluble spore protein|nr:Small, acid-soluble spore protein gamma-type [Bacillales bacterium]